MYGSSDPASLSFYPSYLEKIKKYRIYTKYKNADSRIYKVREAQLKKFYEYALLRSKVN